MNAHTAIAHGEAELSPRDRSVAHVTGFENSFAAEAVSGAPPIMRNSPQKAPAGLYAEQLSGSAFTAPRSSNKRTWLYRIGPSGKHGRGFAVSPTAYASSLDLMDGAYPERWDTIDLKFAPA